MERGNTKQEILEASLDLFSVQGFEATSISQIANAVGIKYGKEVRNMSDITFTGSCFLRNLLTLLLSFDQVTNLVT